MTLTLVGVFLFIIICFILNIKFFVNNHRLKKKIRQENIVSYDKEAEKIINKKAAELSNTLADLEEKYKKTIDELKKQTSSQREELERSIESNKEILRHQEEEKQIYIKKGKEVIQKELDLYKTEERSKIELENQELKHKLGEEYNNSIKIRFFFDGALTSYCFIYSSALTTIFFKF